MLYVLAFAAGVVTGIVGLYVTLIVLMIVSDYRDGEWLEKNI